MKRLHPDKEFFQKRIKEIKKEFMAGSLAYLNALVNCIYDESHLKIEKLNFVDYRALIEAAKEMNDAGGGVDVISEKLKDFFERHGFKIEEEGIGWYVRCEGERRRGR